jgi:EmrB/QacA subfamily drug resistance transporter
MSPASSSQRNTLATLLVVSVALFMVVLDNLIVTVALPAIRADLGATLESLEWTINAYTLAFAVMLMPGAALADRFGRRRLFLGGLALFTAASAAAALAPSSGALLAARAVQGVGGAIVAPLTLTLLAGAFPADRRGAALGIWSAISGLGVALGPLVGGAVVEGISWHWIFWINVPIGIVVIPLAARLLDESYGPTKSLDLPGVGLAAAGLFGVVFGLVRGQGDGWGSPQIVASLAGGVALLAAFIAWELRSDKPMLPMGLFRTRSFAVTNGVSFFMYFGTFGSIFLLTQVLQLVMGYSPLQAGIRMMAWTGATLIVAPLAGIYAERLGGRGFMVTGLALQAGALAWFAATVSVGQQFSEVVVPFVMAGTGMALVFAPSASTLLHSVRDDMAGVASGANNAIREVGGVFGVAVLSTVFAGSGSFGSPQAFVDGVRPALWVGMVVVAAGALVATLVPRRERGQAPAAEALLAA